MRAKGSPPLLHHLGKEVGALAQARQNVNVWSAEIERRGLDAPSAVSEHSSELLGCPISRSLATSCVGLELRLLPSTGITRLHRSYGPLRHPNAPGLSLTVVRLIIPDHALGLPVLRALSLCTCCR